MKDADELLQQNQALRARMHRLNQAALRVHASVLVVDEAKAEGATDGC